jgi:uncharacterized membrane-anchored protein
MKKISLWAKIHPWPARFIIIGIHAILIITAFKTGTLFGELNVSVPAAAFFIFMVVFLTAVFSYPSKSQKNRVSAESFYFRQKSCDFILAASSFCMIVYFGNHEKNIFQSNAEIQAAVSHPVSLPGDSSVRAYKSIAAFNASLKDENGKSLSWKEKKKLLKQQVKEIKKAKDISPGGKVLLILLSVIVALGLLYLLAALSCSIACGGADTLAIIVFLLGTAAIIFFLVRIISRIIGKRAKRKKEGLPSGT